MENLYAIKCLPDKFETGVIAHDMTKNESNECQALTVLLSLPNLTVILKSAISAYSAISQYHAGRAPGMASTGER